MNSTLIWFLGMLVICVLVFIIDIGYWTLQNGFKKK